MANFGYDWVYLITVSKKELFEYEKLLYDHEIPFKSIEEGNRYQIEVPEKYHKISDEMMKDYQAGILAGPVNDFNPRYSTFERGLKIRRVIKQKRAVRGNFMFLLIIMMLMLAMQMLIYLRN